MHVGDSVLIVPCPNTASTNSNTLLVLRHYAHFQSFLRTADPSQVLELLQRSVRELLLYMNKHPDQRVWWSTSGLGVYYLHMRLDPRPKYYNWIPYK